MTRRLYRGYCMQGPMLSDAVRAVNERRDEILALVADLPDATAYLGDYFDASADPAALLRRFEERCAGQ